MALYLKEILPTVINPTNNWKTKLLYEWSSIIGALHTKVRIEKIHENMLVLGVFHPCWTQELYLLSPVLIKTINEKLDQPYIKHIRFKQVSFKKQEPIQTHKIKVSEKKKVQLSKEDESTLAKINDPFLRDALKAFRIRCYQE